MDMMAWAEKVVSGYSNYFNVDGSKKEEYYRLDFKDTSTKIILFALLFWIICAPIAMVWIAMKCCYHRKVHKYSKVDVAACKAVSMYNSFLSISVSIRACIRTYL